MASFNAFGVEDLFWSFEKLAAIPDDVITAMCSAAADIAVTAYKAAVPVRTGQLRDSIRKFKKYSKYGGFYYKVYPYGKRKDDYRLKYKRINRRSKQRKLIPVPVQNGEVGFMLEYGAPHKHVPALQWMSKTNEQIADQCVKAQFAIYSDYIDKTGGST